MFRAKDKSPYDEAQMGAVFLNPDVRVSTDKKTSKLQYPAGPYKAPALSGAAKAQRDSTVQVVENLAKASASADTKVGVDVEDVRAMPMDNDTFMSRNFTDKEQTYCHKAPNPRASFAGRWSAKEAVFKALGVQGKGAGAGLKDIEIVNDDKGVPVVGVSQVSWH